MSRVMCNNKSQSIWNGSRLGYYSSFEIVKLKIDKFKNILLSDEKRSGVKHVCALRYQCKHADG